VKIREEDMDENYKSNFIGNFLRHFENDEGNKPPPPADARVEPAGAGTGPDVQATPGVKDILSKAQEAGAQASKEKKAERKSAAKEKGKAAWSRTKEVAKNMKDTVKGLADKDVQGDISVFIVDKLAHAGGKVKDAHQSIEDRALTQMDLAVAKTKEKTTQLADKTMENLISKPADKIKALGGGVKKMGRGVGEYFANKGRNMVDRHHMNQAYAESDHYRNKAEKFERKLEKKVAKQGRIAEIKDGVDAKSSRGERLGRESSRLNEKIQEMRKISSEHRNRSQQTRESANVLWANIKSRKKKK
jgi:hypothetical protein